MNTVQISELEAIAEKVRNGETFEILDGERAIATVVPKEQAVPAKRLMTPEERIEQLIREGKATRGTGKIPDWFFTAPRPKFEGSVLEQLLADRRKNDW